MRDKDKKLIEAAENDASVIKGKARNTEMFKDYFKGMGVTEIARKYGVSRQRVSVIKKRDRWNQLSADIRDKAYSELSYAWKDFVGKVTVGLKKDWDRLSMKLFTDETAMLSPDERAHGRWMLDHLIKATSIADESVKNLHTLNQDHIKAVRHEVILPPGVDTWGVIPPAPNVVQVTKQVEDDTDPVLTEEDIEELT